METLVTFISIILRIILVLVPIILFYILKKNQFKYKFISYLILSLIISIAFSFISAWWSDYSDSLLMNHYGYNFDGINYTEKFKSVSLENLERVKQLEISYFGIGWPLQAIFSFVIFIPYIIVIYFIGLLFNRLSSKHISP